MWVGLAVRKGTDDSHCVNLVVKDDITRQGVFDIMNESGDDRQGGQH
jgi:hypothetical protein